MDHGRLTLFSFLSPESCARCKSEFRIDQIHVDGHSSLQTSDSGITRFTRRTYAFVSFKPQHKNPKISQTLSRLDAKSLAFSSDLGLVDRTRGLRKFEE